MTSYTHEELAEDLKATYTDEQLASAEVLAEPLADEPVAAEEEAHG